MNIRHYMTLDMGRGPMTLVEVGDAELGSFMLRISHKAVYNAVAEVDPTRTKAQIDALPNLSEVTDHMTRDIGIATGEMILGWLATRDRPHGALRWRDDGVALLFRTEAEAVTHDAQIGDAPPERAKRKRIMMG